MLTRARRGLLLAGMVLLSACRSGSRCEVWTIPEGYVGWLRLDYGVEGALPLPIEKGCYVVRFTRAGRLQTSSRNRPQTDRNDYGIEASTGRQKLRGFSWPAVQEYGIQNVYSWGRLADFVRFGAQLECAFVGTGADFTSNGRDCNAWQPGQPEPPKLPKRITGVR